MKLTLNLASRSYVNERALSLSCLILSLLLVLLLVFQARSVLQEQEQNRAYQAEISKLEAKLNSKLPKQFTKQQLAEQQETLRQAQIMLQRDAFRWTALFDRLEGLLPRHVSLRNLNPDYKTGSLKIEGVARQLGDLQQLLDNLHGDNFKEVFLNSQSWIEVVDYTGNKRPALLFSIQLEGVF